MSPQFDPITSQIACFPGWEGGIAMTYQDWIEL